MVKVRTKLGLIMVKVRTKLGLIMVKVIESNLVEMEMHPPSSAARAGLICLICLGLGLSLGNTAA